MSAKDPVTTKRGGARPGSGRPRREGGPMRRVSIRLEPQTAEFVEADRAGARQALERWVKRSARMIP